jgi:hypothetical protein
MQRPPHCWGVGLARTGNTSLCAALLRVGYVSVKQDPQFHELRELDGGSGATVLLNFKYLDYVFPGSRFVLTTRDVASWLASMERSHRLNPRPIQGEHERIARRMAIFECVGYDETKLRNAFDRHHAEVHRYFAKRPDDLVELNLPAGEAWDRLCPFLGQKTPDADFPDLNKWAAA